MVQCEKCAELEAEIVRKVQVQNEWDREQQKLEADNERLRKAIEVHKQAIGTMGRQTTLANVQEDEKLWKELDDE